jgi:hypothetical protein
MLSDSASRYTALPFPAYSFVPGQSPHPRWDPAGHSYQPPGTPEPEVPSTSAAAWRTSDAYLFGCDLYNHGYWWEAHESWEGLWQPTDRSSPQGRFLKGLIQVAACHLVCHMGKHAAAATLLRRVDANLQVVIDARSDPVFMGIEVPAWRARVSTYFAALLRDGEVGPVAAVDAAYPAIVLHGF